MGGKVLAEMDNEVEIGDIEVGSRWAEGFTGTEGKIRGSKKEKREGMSDGCEKLYTVQFWAVPNFQKV